MNIKDFAGNLENMRIVLKFEKSQTEINRSQEISEE